MTFQVFRFFARLDRPRRQQQGWMARQGVGGVGLYWVAEGVRDGIGHVGSVLW